MALKLKLSVPVSKRSLPKEVATSPRKARAWVESLPLTRATEAARELVQNLDALNHAKLEPEERVAVVDTYRTVAAVIFEELEAIYANANLPLPPKAREAADAAHLLHTQFAFAYKLYLLERTGKLIVFNAKKHITPLLLRVLQHLRGIIGVAYKTYQPVPIGVWQESHQVFRYALEHALESLRIDTTEKDTVRDVYVEVVMLSLADPCRFTPKDMSRTQDILRLNRSLVDLHAEGGAGNTQKHFRVALESDQAPTPPQNPASAKATGEWRLVDPSRLVERLAQRKPISGGKAAANRTAEEIADLTARLVRLWGDPPKRQFHRHPTDSLASVCSGVRALAHFAEVAESLGDGPGFNEHQTRPMATLPPVTVTSSTFASEDWQVLNQSTNGLRLRRVGDGRVGICVGEAVGVRAVGARQWQVGVVRWLTMLEPTTIEFGVELISSSMRHMGIQPPTNTSITRLVPAVLLGAGEDEGAFDMLLAPVDTYAPAREFTYGEGPLTKRGRASTLVERTARFDLFQTESA